MTEVPQWPRVPAKDTRDTRGGGDAVVVTHLCALVQSHRAACFRSVPVSAWGVIREHPVMIKNNKRKQEQKLFFC